METTSIRTPSPSPKSALVRAEGGADHCETCGAEVDLAKSMLFKQNRIVGCRACTWGTLPPRSSTAPQWQVPTVTSEPACRASTPARRQRLRTWRDRTAQVWSLVTGA